MVIAVIALVAGATVGVVAMGALVAAKLEEAQAREVQLRQALRRMVWACEQYHEDAAVRVAIRQAREVLEA